MDVKAATSGLVKFAVMLVRVLVFPLLWMKAIAVAKAHQENDPKAVTKVAAGIVIGLVLTIGLFLAIYNFQTTSVEGIYDSMDGRMQNALLENEYQDASDLIVATQGQIATIERNIGLAEDDRDAAPTPEARDENETKIAGLQETLESAEKTLAEAQQTKADRTQNHAFYLQVKPLIAAQDDQAILAAMDNRPADLEYKPASVAKAFAVKNDAVADMEQALYVFVYPGLVGSLFGPMVIALGNVLRQSFEPSETVGFKPYPGATMGWFLILGGFGVPAALFAAWTMMDVEGRTYEGQISL